MQSSENELVSNIMCSEKQKSCLCCGSLIFYLSSSLCGEASGLFMLGRSFLQLLTGSHSRSRARWCHTGMLGFQYVLSQSVWRYSYLGILPLPGVPAYPCISLPTLQSLSGGHLLFLPPYSLPSPPAPFCYLFFFSFGNFPFSIYGLQSLPPNPTPELPPHNRIMRGLWPRLAN